MTNEEFHAINNRAQEHSTAIIKIFDALISNWSLCKGYIGFENGQGMITIFHTSSETEKYYHLNKGKGFTGYVYKSGIAAIYDRHNQEHQDSLEEPGDLPIEFCEMVATINYRKSGENVEKAGVILIDKEGHPDFDEHDLTRIQLAAKNIGDILSNVNPWKLRSWSSEYDRVCTNKYRVELQRALKNRLQNYDGISLKTEIVEGGHLLSPEYFHTPTNDGSEFKKVSDRVRQIGTSFYDPDLVTQGVLGIPFPMNGPIKGVISVERLKPKAVTDEEELEIDNIREDVIDVIESVPYSLFKQVYDTNDAGVKMFSFLNKCISNDQSLFDSLNELCKEFGEIDDASIEIYLPESFEVSANDSLEAINLVSKEELQSTFTHEDDQSCRPRFWVVEENQRQIIKCGVFNGKRLVAGIKTIPKTDEISQSDTDGPIIEMFATFIGKLLGRHMRFQSLDEFLRDVREKKLSDENLFLKEALAILQCNYFAKITQEASDQELQLIMHSSDDSDIKKVGKEEMSDFVNQLNIGREIINVNNNMAELNELRASGIIRDPYAVKAILNKFRVRSFIIQRINSNIILMAVIHREKSFKRLFDKEDENNLKTMCTFHPLLFPKLVH